MKVRGMKVDHEDDRDSMTRLLQDGLLPDGLVVVQYDQQWKTLTKARNLGLVDDNHYITPLGRKRMAKAATPTP
jgi:hypothetical protein